MAGGTYEASRGFDRSRRYILAGEGGGDYLLMIEREIYA